jgi:tRNA(Ile)-lysidine synthase
MNLIEKIEKFMDFSLYDEIYIGFSGGADSTALLLIFAELSKSHSFKLTSVHFEHGLRGEESLADAQWCRKFAKARNITYLEYNLDTLNNMNSGEGVEEAARRLRLEKWQEITARQSSAVALGHHAGDKIENLFIRLLRGSNCSGLTSLRHFSEVNGIIFLRPLLDITKKEILSYLETAGITDWRKDSTNEYNDYRRNFLRNKILTELFEFVPSAEKAISSSYCAIEDDARFIENEAKAVYNNLKQKKYISGYNDLLPMPNSILIRVLRYWIADELGYDFIPNKALLERLNEEIKLFSTISENYERKLIPLTTDTFICIHKGRVSLYQKKEIFRGIIEWNWKEQSEIIFSEYNFKAIIINKKQLINLSQHAKNIAYFDLNQIPEKLTLKTWKNADKFIPFGSNKEVKVSKALQNEKLPRETRETLPIVLANNSIIWVTGIRRSAFAPVTDKTIEILALRFS